VALPAGVIPQNADGSAMTRSEAAEAREDEQQMKDHVEGRSAETPADKRKG
jgi:hypothetical protein